MMDLPIHLDALVWMADQIVHNGRDDVPEHLSQIVEEYRFSSRCEANHPDLFRPAEEREGVRNINVGAVHRIRGVHDVRIEARCVDSRGQELVVYRYFGLAGIIGVRYVTEFLMLTDPTICPQANAGGES